MWKLLMGVGVIHFVEGIIDHLILGFHHVNETVPLEKWDYRDVGYLAWGALMLGEGWFLWRT